MHTAVKLMMTSIIALLQIPSGLVVNTDIPLWGICVGVAGGVAGFAALKMQLTAHQQSDDRQFNTQNNMLTEIRGDVKKLIGRVGIDHNE